jgi:hypothetical protein
MAPILLVGIDRSIARGLSNPLDSLKSRSFFVFTNSFGHLGDDPVLLRQPLAQFLHLPLQGPLLAAGVLRERRSPVFEELLLPGVEQRGAYVVLLAHRRHRLPL